MARYIDADALIRLIEIDAVCNGGNFSKREVIGSIKVSPTFDVVPKSEVEELQAKLVTLRKENVELLVSKETDIYISMEKLVKVRTEHPIFKAIEEKVAREIFEEIESISSDFPLYGNINTVILSERDLAFIKKKYTEGIDEKGSN